MLYVSVDIETTGTDPQTDQILSIGAIIEDTDKKLDFESIPKFHGIIAHKKIIGSPYALIMNYDILQIINDWNSEERMIKKDKIAKYYNVEIGLEKNIMSMFVAFLFKNFNIKDKKIVFAGKNFGSFDLQFIKNSCERHNIKFEELNYSYKYLEPGNMYVDFKNDKEIPSLSKCKTRIGMDKNIKHDAISDSWDIIQLLRKKY